MFRFPTHAKPFFAAALVLTLQYSPEAKLTSPSYQKDRATEMIDNILKETRLEDDSHWGPQFQSEINRTAGLFGMNYYQIFADLKIKKAMARCAIYAKNESDYQSWLDMMARFDQAVENLNAKDKSRYYFARGLAILYVIPDKIRDLPAPFYKAAENGYASTFLADYIQKSTGRNSEISGDIYERLARSYQTGGNSQEAYKFFMMALKAGKCDPGIILEMVLAAANKGSDSLAYRTGVLLLTLFSPWDGVKSCNTEAASRLPFAVAMPAEQVWDIASTANFDTICAILSSPSAPNGAIRERDLNRFDGRYVQTILRSTGSYSDLFLVAVTLSVWADTTMVKRFATRIAGSIDDSQGAIAMLAQKIRDDPRLAQDQELARWEADRWKKAGKIEEFATRFPQRALQAGDKPADE